MGVAAFVYRLTVVGLFVAFVASVGLPGQETAVSQESITPVASNAPGAPTVEFNLPDMMCEDGCAWTVKDILSKQPGAKDVRVDFEAKTATVAIEEGEFDSRLAIAELVDKGFGNSQLKSAKPDSSSSEAAAKP